MKKLSDKHIESVIELIRRYREINASMFHEASGRYCELDRWKIIQEKTRNYGDDDQFECILCLSVENGCNKCIRTYYKSDRVNHGCFADKSLMELQYSKSPEHAVNLCHIRADYLQKLFDKYLNEVKDEL